MCVLFQAQQMRYVLTDILMKVTNEEMYRVTEEVLTEMRAKGTFDLTWSLDLKKQTIRQ